MPAHTGSSNRQQQTVCIRPGCPKPCTRSIPTSLFTGRRAKVCKACYTWMRRHFQIEPNGKHVRCADVGVLDRCRDMLIDFAKVGVFPVESARRTPNLLLPPTNPYYSMKSRKSRGSKSSECCHDHSSGCSCTTSTAAAALATNKRVKHERRRSRRTRRPRTFSTSSRQSTSTATPPRRSDDGLTLSSPASPSIRHDEAPCGSETPPVHSARGHVKQETRRGAQPTYIHGGMPAAKADVGTRAPCEWEEFGFDELSDADIPQPPVEVGHTSPADVDTPAHGSTSDCDVDMKPSEASAWDAADGADDMGEFDALSTMSMTAWRALVDDGTPRSFDLDMDYDTVWGDADMAVSMPQTPVMAATSVRGAHGSTASAAAAPAHTHSNRFTAYSSSPTAILFPSGVHPSVVYAPRTPTYSGSNRDCGTSTRASITARRRATPVYYPAATPTVSVLLSPTSASAAFAGIDMTTKPMAVSTSTASASPSVIGVPRAFHVTGGISPNMFDTDMKPEVALPRTYAQDVRVAACGHARPRSVDRAMTPPCPPLARVTSTDSLFSCGIACTPEPTLPAVIEQHRYAMPPRPPSQTPRARSGGNRLPFSRPQQQQQHQPQQQQQQLQQYQQHVHLAPAPPARPYGRRRASVGVSRAVAAVAASVEAV